MYGALSPLPIYLNDLMFKQRDNFLFTSIPVCENVNWIRFVYSG
jgi:hypothetical protein